jgi:hypothetical protein
MIAIYACKHAKGINFEKTFPDYLEARNARKIARNCVGHTLGTSSTD